jgi:hypothetical protein
LLLFHKSSTMKLSLPNFGKKELVQHSSPGGCFI